MSSRSIPFSARISPEDAEFISGLSLEGASTPSDKLRALLADARRRHEGSQDYASALALAQDTLAPAKRRLLAAEHAQGLHSALVQRSLDWLPETLAYVAAASAGELTPQALHALEHGLVERLGRLMDGVLQLALTRHSPCYDADSLKDRLGSVLELARLIDRCQEPQ